MAVVTHDKYGDQGMSSSITRDEAVARLRDCLRGLETLLHPTNGNNWRSNRPRFRYPGLLRYALGDLLGLPVVDEPFDKVRWSLRAQFRGSPILLEDRKLGFFVGVPGSMDDATEEELIKRLLGATKIVALHVRTLAKDQLTAGNLTLTNEFWSHDTAYRYFRELAKEAYAKPSPEPVVTVTDLGTVTHYQPFKYTFEGNFCAVAMTNEFFSRLEHILIHVLPSQLDFSPENGALVRLMSAGWKEKFKAVFPLTKEPSAKKLYDRLEAQKEEVRNPKAHGGFLKEGRSAWFHVPGVGALPVDILERKFDGYLESVALSYEDICGLFDEMDNFMRNHQWIGFGMQAVEAGFEPSFDNESLVDYRSAMKLHIATDGKPSFASYIEHHMLRIDAYNNYEF